MKRITDKCQKIIDPPAWENIDDALGKQNRKINLRTDFNSKSCVRKG